MKWMRVFTVLIITLCSNQIAIAQEIDNNSLCEHFKYAPVAHTPRADVTHNPSQIMMDDPVDIPLTIDMAERYGINVPSGIEMNAPVGFISVYKDGRILYDGKDISGNIKDECNHDTGTGENDAKAGKDGD